MTKSDRHSIALLAVILLQMGVVAAEPELLIIQHSANILASVTIGWLLAQLTHRRRAGWTAAALGIIPAVLDLAVPWGDAPLSLNLLKSALWMAFPLYLSARLFRKMFTSKAITTTEVTAAVTVYILAGLFFANVYELYSLLLTDPISWGPNFREVPAYGEYLYFSFITMASVGFGDVTPAHVTVRLTVVAQAVFGLLYMATLVARFVAQQTTGAILEDEEEREGLRDEFAEGDHGGREL